jgi:hypothetical protein
MARPNGYNLTDEIAMVVHLAVQRVERLGHIRPGQIIHGVSQARVRTSHGVYAQCHGLRFKNGKREHHTNDGYAWVWPELRIKGRDVLYYITYYLPRFLDQSPQARLQTLVHELYHISPHFNGDLRRFPGRNEFHGNRYEDFDGVVDSIVDELRPQLDFARYPFLTCTFDELCVRYGAVVGNRLKRFKPRRVPVSDLAPPHAVPAGTSRPPAETAVAADGNPRRQKELFR